MILVGNGKIEIKSDRQILNEAKEMAEIKHLTWQSTAGYSQERWAIMRGDSELGSIIKSYSGKYQAMLNYNFTGGFKAENFVHFNAAVKWIEKQTENIHSWSELNSLLA